MTPSDYRTWVNLQTEIAKKSTNDGETKHMDDEILDEDEFEIISWRVWTDVLLQILKVY